MHDLEADPRQRPVIRTPVAQQHLTAHAEMHDEGLDGVAEASLADGHGHPQELAAPNGRDEARPGEPVNEVFGGPVVALQRALVEHLDALDRRAGDGGREAVTHDLNLG